MEEIEIKAELEKLRIEREEREIAAEQRKKEVELVAKLKKQKALEEFFL